MQSILILAALALSLFTLIGCGLLSVVMVVQYLGAKLISLLNKMEVFIKGSSPLGQTPLNLPENISRLFALNLP